MTKAPDGKVVETEIVYDNLNQENQLTDEEIEELCCVFVDPFPPCSETGKTERWYSSSANKEDFWPAESLALIQLAKGNPYLGIKYESRTRPCGIIETRYSAEPCCDDPTIPEMFYDYGKSFEEIGPSAVGWIYWRGGKANCEMVVSGKGFWMNENYTTKELKSIGPYTHVQEGEGEDQVSVPLFKARVYTDKDACGYAGITIRDACYTSLRAEVKCTVGVWKQVSYDAGGPNNRECAAQHDLFSCSFYNSGISDTEQLTFGKYSLSPTGQESGSVGYHHQSTNQGLWGSLGSEITVKCASNYYPEIMLPRFKNNWNPNGGRCYGGADPHPSGVTAYWNNESRWTVYEFVCP